MENKYIIFDTHAHYDDDAFDKDREELLKDLKLNGVVGILNCASSYESIEKTYNLTIENDFIYGALGIHPENACASLLEEGRSEETGLENFRELIDVARIVDERFGHRAATVGVQLHFAQLAHIGFGFGRRAFD